MRSFNIFSLAKSNGETWFEHSKNTFHLGRILWDICEEKISKYFTKDQYLWCCLFHDIGKTVWEGFGDKHTPYTKAVFGNIRGQKEYENLLEQFELPDFTEDQQLIQAIEDHHDNKIKGSEFITLADCIASSNFGYLSEMDSGSYGAYLKFLISDMEEIKGYYLNKITFPESSYLDRVKFGQLFLTKMLREAVWKFCEETQNTHYLFDIESGCKILTKIKSPDLKAKIDACFEEYLINQFEHNFPISILVGGKADDFVKVRQYILESQLQKFLDELLKGCLQDILRNIQQRYKILQINPNEITDSDELLKLVENYTGLTRDELIRVSDYDSLWLGFHLGITGALTQKYRKIKVESLRPGKLFLQPLMEWLENENADPEDVPISLILNKIGVSIEKKSYADQFFPSIARFWNRKNCFLKPDNKVLHLKPAPILKFIVINDQIDVKLWSESKDNICASCGTFKPFFEGGPFIVGHTSKYRETVGKSRDDQPLCPLCFFSLYSYSMITNVEKGKSLRPRESVYLVLSGIKILNDVENFIQGDSLFEEEIIKRLENFKKQYNLEETIVYVPQQIDLDTIVYTITPNPKYDRYRRYPSLQKYSILSEIRDLVSSSENILGVSLQEKPEIKGPFIIRTQEGEINLKDMEAEINLFNFIRDITDEPRTLIFYFRLWQQNPVLALSRIVKDSNMQGKRGVYLSKENLERGVKMMSEDDQKFQLTRELWQIVRILGQLPSGGRSKYEVGKPVKKFKGTPESLDYHMNFLLKEAKVGTEVREEALRVASKLRDKLSKLDDKQQKELGNYVKKTTHLFSALAWQEVKQKGGNDDE